MSKDRSRMLTQAALYAHNHTDIDPHDIVAFYASMSTPINLAERDIFGQVCSEVIADIKAKDPEEFEGCYSAALQSAWDENKDRFSSYVCDMRGVLDLHAI